MSSAMTSRGGEDQFLAVEGDQFLPRQGRARAQPVAGDEAAVEGMQGLAAFHQQRNS